MLYDPQLEERLKTKTKFDTQGLAPTISSVFKESEKLTQEKDEYKDLLKELAGSDFIAEMKKLRTEIIG